MSGLIKARAFICIFLLLSPLSVSSASTDDIQAALQTLGFPVLLRDIPVTLLDAIDQRRKETGLLSISQHEQLKRFVGSQYIPADLLMDLSTRLAGRYSDQDMVTVNNLLRTPAAEKLFRLRAAAATDEALEQIRQLARTHESKPLDSNRLTLLERFDDASADTEFFIAAQVMSIYTIKRAFDAFQGLTPDKPETENAMMNAFYQQLHRPSKFTISMTHRYAFRDVPDQELMEFIQIYRFGALQGFLRQIMEALQIIMQERAEKVVKEMERLR